MAAPVTTKAKFTSHLDKRLIAASPGRIVREERLLVLRRMARWIHSHRHAPQPGDLAVRHQMPEKALRDRLDDLCAESLVIKSGPGYQPTPAGWALIRWEPIACVFASDANQRAAQYRMCAYFREATGNPEFPLMYEAWLRLKSSFQDWSAA